MNQRDQQDQRDWRSGISKRHRITCRQCGGLIHERGRHFRPEQVAPLLAKLAREAARAAACGAGQVVQAGQDTASPRQMVKPTRE